MAVPGRNSVLKENLLTVLTVIGVIGGAVLGLALRYTTDEPYTARQVMYIAFPGELFMRMLKCLIVPLLMSSIISAIGSLDTSMSGKVAARSFIYYFCTTACAVTLGIILVTTIQPGVGRTIKIAVSNNTEIRPVLTVDTLMDLIRNAVPINIVQATFQQYQTRLMYQKGDPAIYEDYKMSGTFIDTTNVLGLVTFSIVLGVAIGKLKEKGKPLLSLVQSLSDATMSITTWVIYISPVGVFFLIAAKMIEFEDIGKSLELLSLYFIVVLLGLFIHCFVTISLIFFICTKEMPYKYIAKMSRVLATAFGTGSSNATMPISIQWLDSIGVDPRITRFVIPVGATINMDGTALYEAVAALFIAQFRNVEYTFGQVVAVSVTATAASIGAAGIPQAGLITMVMVLQTLGLPADDYVLIIAVDWLLDRVRTTVNVLCDSLGTIIVNHLSAHELHAISALENPHELEELTPAKGRDLDY